MAMTITLNKGRILELLSMNKLKELFTQHLGWNNFNQTMPVQVEGITYTLNGIVEKEGFAIYELINRGSEPIKYDLRKKISNKLAKTQLEHSPDLVKQIIISLIVSFKFQKPVKSRFVIAICLGIVFLNKFAFAVHLCYRISRIRLPLFG